MTYTLLAGGYRDSIAILTFTPPSTAGGAGKLTLVTEAPSPPSPSWVESAGERVYAVSETDTGGDLAVFDLVRSANGEVMGIKVAHKDEAGVAPCHILRDGERLVVSNYLSGTVSTHKQDGTRLTTLSLPYAYSGVTPPNPGRQEASHAHGALRGPRGVLVCDLGSDQVYLLNEDATAVVDWIQCEPGFGPRHAVYDPSSERIYVIGEMGHAVVAFPASAGRDTTAIDGSRAHILPPVDEVTAARMDAAEILLPVPGTVFASNRLQHHAPGTENTVNNGEGDTVAVVLYDSEGKAESVKQVRTGCCCVRAMSVSPDGQFVAVAGLCDGGAEVYALSGERKDVWTRAAVLRDITKITTFAWVQ